MPELPEVEALAAFLREQAVGRPIVRVDVGAVSALKTFDPPPSALYGSTVAEVSRHGKFLDIRADGYHLVIHLARAGWLQWRDALPAAPPRPGKGPLALRVHLGDRPGDAPEQGEPAARPGFDLTEAGTQKRLAVYIVEDPAQVPGVARLGVDPLADGFTVDVLAAKLAGVRQRLKGVLTDQTLLAGVGNAYSDEVLHTARLSPFALAAALTPEQVGALHSALVGVLSDAVSRSVGQRAATLKAEKHGGMRVHGRAGLPCPVCGDTVREVSYADSSLQYCPTCQTGGRPLADRRLSKLLK